jgi:hypothetical protein
MSHINLIVII